MFTDLLEKAYNVLASYRLCSNCLGRLFGMLGTGLSNKDRGEAIMTILIMSADQSLKKGCSEAADKLIRAVGNIIGFEAAEKFLFKLGLSNKHVDEECYLCGNIFLKLDNLITESLAELKNYEFQTFLVGTNLDAKIIEREDNLRSRFEAGWGESIKSELNREIGKKINFNFKGLQADFDNPQLVIEYIIPDFKFRVKVNPVFIYGRYNKLVRGIPQTKWICKKCGGAGCEKCGFKGKMYDTSVEELISVPVIKELSGETAKFHGAGREDIDAVMSGEGRPFVLEVKGVKKRFVELERIKKLIDNHAKGRVKVNELKWTTKDTVRKIKAFSKITKKTYKAFVELPSKVSDEDLERAGRMLSNIVIQQRTPIRVIHRRSDRLREKQIYSVKIKKISGRKLELTIDCQGGLYVKELISGDGGRTSPSLSEILGTEAKCTRLDVLKVDFPDELIKNGALNSES